MSAGEIEPMTYLPAEALAAMEADETQRIPADFGPRVKELRQRFMKESRG